MVHIKEKSLRVRERGLEILATHRPPKCVCCDWLVPVARGVPSFPCLHFTEKGNREQLGEQLCTQHPGDCFS